MWPTSKAKLDLGEIKVKVKDLFVQISQSDCVRRLFLDLDIGLDDSKVLIALGAFYAFRKSWTAGGAIIDAVSTFVCSRFDQDEYGWVAQYGQWAVITGGCTGIGRGYAEELASRGLDIVIISNNLQRLVDTKSDIESQWEVQVEYIVADFAADDQKNLYQRISESLDGKEIGILVNNVGIMYDNPDLLLEVPRDRLWDLIHVNAAAAVMMTHMLLPEMVSRGRGAVVVVSAGSSTKVTPKMTVYSATKRFLDYFIQGLAYEYQDSGVTFQCLIPFYVATKMKGMGDIVTDRSLFVPCGSTYAQSAVRTLGRSFWTTGYFPHSLQWWLSNMIPTWLWMWGAEKVNDFWTRDVIKRKRISQKLEMM